MNVRRPIQTQGHHFEFPLAQFAIPAGPGTLLSVFLSRDFVTNEYGVQLGVDAVKYGPVDLKRVLYLGVPANTHVDMRCS